MNIYKLSRDVMFLVTQLTTEMNVNNNFYVLLTVHLDICV
jgi:hypothetical protein